MCISVAGIVRVHGCLWCGSTEHARPECEGPSLPPNQVQMTFAEWQKFEPRRMMTDEDAREYDRRNFHHRDGKIKQGVHLQGRAATRPRSCLPVKLTDGTVET